MSNEEIIKNAYEHLKLLALDLGIGHNIEDFEFDNMGREPEIYFQYDFGDMDLEEANDLNCEMSKSLEDFLNEYSLEKRDFDNDHDSMWFSIRIKND